MNIRKVGPDDAQSMFDMMCKLDNDTKYMMYEPGERKESNNSENLKKKIENALSNGDLFLGIINENNNLSGFLWAERGSLRRIRHTAYIVVGMLTDMRNHGVGTQLFEYLDKWAKDSGIVKLELSVECSNEPALHLYKKAGFSIEGKRIASMLVDGVYIDEYYMGKLINM